MSHSPCLGSPLGVALSKIPFWQKNPSATVMCDVLTRDNLAVVHDSAIRTECSVETCVGVYTYAEVLLANVFLNSTSGDCAFNLGDKACGNHAILPAAQRNLQPCCSASWHCQRDSFFGAQHQLLISQTPHSTGDR